MRARRPAVALAACLALVGLSACDKPTPSVSLHSGDITIHDDAFSYCFAGQDRTKAPDQPGACRFDVASRTPKVLSVRPGDEVLVDVDKQLADSGWFVSLKGTQGRESRLAVRQDHVTSFQPDFNASPTITVSVQKLTAPRDDANVDGLWQFVLVPA